MVPYHSLSKLKNQCYIAEYLLALKHLKDVRSDLLHLRPQKVIIDFKYPASFVVFVYVNGPNVTIHRFLGTS